VAAFRRALRTYQDPAPAGMEAAGMEAAGMEAGGLPGRP
jgi:hypothetical protein